MATESKAERVERIKNEKDGLDVLESIREYALNGGEIHPDDIDRFKWYGLYTQNKNLQGSDDESLYFMLRVKLEGGYITPKQAKVLGELSIKYGRNTGDVTTRQDIQFHWIRVADLPAIFDALADVGLSTLEAAGDCPRNIICCPINGMDHDQIDDVRDIVSALNELYRGNRTFSNLPRKFKIGVSGCAKHCTHHEVQDLGFSAVKNSIGQIHFCVSVGGGQASNRRIATPIGYINRSNIVKIAEVITLLYRDFGCRSNRSKARLGHLVETWGVKHFISEVEERAGVKLERFNAQTFTPYPRRGHFGVSAAKKEGYSLIGCALTGGRISGEMLVKLGGILEFYKAEGLTLTAAQNFVILNAPTDLTEAMVQSLEGVGFHPRPSVFEARTLACTGLDFCKFAVSETKALAIETVEYLKTRFPDFTEPVSISINGCPNSCAHPHIVDMGFVGTIIKQGDDRLKGFDLIVGGYLEGEKSRFAIKTGVKVAPEEVAPLIESLIFDYEKSLSADFGNYLLEKYHNESTFSTSS
ncbi:nitrite/sulfite reductase [Sulfuricurvum sp.]|uniref:nitrite/sulfite reductase n=1 Tax=Sulfuricurvum sp. TaxID=2025608 RepID=UPI002606585A|nr:nitrite/sulfite reductase [Sulfuricurvum sp.]MDD2781127.1 nitrite/sulfite reductase [Sulfuricurvum sp.]